VALIRVNRSALPGSALVSCHVTFSARAARYIDRLVEDLKRGEVPRESALSGRAVEVGK